jgi:hypothetical protein
MVFFLTAEAYGLKLKLEGWGCGCGFAVSLGCLVRKMLLKH